MTDKPTSPPPAYFLSLSLENVRGFGKKQTISFARPDGRPAQWTIILGDNGVGKTTVLKALAAVGIMPSEGLVSDSKFRDSNFNYNWQVKWWPTRNNSEYTTAINYCAHIGEINNLIAPSRSSEQAIVITSKHEESVSGFHLLVESIPVELWGLFCYGYGASRSTGTSSLSDTPETVDTCASLFDDHANLLNPEEWFLSIDYGIRLLAEDKRKQLSDANTRVRQMIKDILPGVTDLRIDNSGTPQKPQISLQFFLYGAWVRLHDMSLGYQTTVVWLTDFASKLYARYPKSDNPLAEPAVVLIDEIDLHLHPKWQRELLGILSGIFPNTQFIATAHSPLVVQAAGDAGANVVLLKRDGDQTIVHQNLEDVRNWRIDQIMTSELFGLETARSPDAEQKLKRRAALLTKSRRTAAEKKELDALTRELDAEPLGELPSEREVDAVLQELRQRLQRKDSDAATV